MRFGLEESTIDQINTVFAHYPQVESALIYGSRAKGNYKPGSDIDLTLTGDKVDLSLIHKIEIELDDLLLPYTIELSAYPHISNPDLVDHIDRVGLLFYHADLFDTWGETILGEIAEVQTGPFGSQLHQRDYVEIGTPIITVEHLVNDKIEHVPNIPKVSAEDRDRLIKYTLQEGDIVFSRVGSVDRCGYVSEKESGWMFSGRLLRVRPDKKLADPKFVYFYISQNSVKGFIRNIAVGTTMPSLNTSLLSQVSIVLPPLDEQRRIATVLSTLDAKIDLLRRQNHTLEQIAQTLFKRWFVAFEFPCDHGQPYKSSGGAMQPSELGEIPEGWRVGTLGKILNLNYGKGLRTDDRQDGEYLVVGSSGIVGTHSEYLVQAPGIVIGRKGTIGKVIWLDNHFYPIDTTFYVTDNLGLNELYFHYFILLRQRFDRIGSDSAVPGLNRNLALSLEEIIPELDIIRRFGDIVRPIFAKSHSNSVQIQTLTRLRDTLLPKLMSGQLRVKP